MIALLLIGLLLAQGLGFGLSLLQHQHLLLALREEYVLARVASVVRLLAETPMDVHARLIQAVSTPPLRFAIAPTPVLEASEDTRHNSRLRQQLAALSATESANIRLGLRVIEPPREPRPPPPPEARDRYGYGHGRRDDPPRPPGMRTMDMRPGRPAVMLTVAVRLAEDRWLNVISLPRPPEPFWRGITPLSIGLTALILSTLLIFMVRRITRPLAQLAAEAERLGRGEAGEPLPEYGPLDIQETIRAFNHMRARLERFVQDRTRLLAAISHDLRTPITALRVRAELIEETETREKMCATLDEMQRMTEATLTFVREEAVQEETRRLDLDALVQSVCDDLSDTGMDVRFCGPGRLPYRCRAVSLKRALRNLVENAILYGQRARVTLTTAPEALYIIIDDDGPGIPEADWERVFEPFVRLETSRNRETGGVGLGMAIARSIVRGHGGEITLANGPQGGLRVTMQLPRDGLNHHSGRPTPASGSLS
jgi:signal transduction histidine kinase